MDYYIHYKVWNEITYAFPNLNRATVEVWEWMTYFVHTLLGMRLLIRAGIKIKSI